MKNGNQHTTKAPTIEPKVRIARISRALSAFIFALTLNEYLAKRFALSSLERCAEALFPRCKVSKQQFRLFDLRLTEGLSSSTLFLQSIESVVREALDENIFFTSLG